MTTGLVPPFDDDAFRRVLCVVAHPDDVEYGTSSAVAAWTARGVDVPYLLLTRGEAGMDSSPPERTAQLRTEEQIAGSRAVGVSEVEFRHLPWGRPGQRQPANPIGWILIGLGIYAGLYTDAGRYAVLDCHLHHGDLPSGPVAAAVASGLWTGEFLVLPLVILLFPDGRLPRRWRVKLASRRAGGHRRNQTWGKLYQPEPC